MIQVCFYSKRMKTIQTTKITIIFHLALNNADIILTER